jgi:hypothetical protein
MGGILSFFLSKAQNPKWKDFTVISPELVRVISEENSFQEDNFLESTMLTFNNSII